MRARALCTFIFLFTFLFVFGQNWQSKIDPGVLQAAADGQEVEFLVLLTEQADLSGAAFFPKKEEKGAYVFQQLTETAERTQVNVLTTLEGFQADHRPYWIVNSVWATGGSSLLEALARLPEVAEIQSNPKVRFEEPEQKTDGGMRAVEWGISNINADDVWAMGHTGTGAVIGGQDTGYDWDVAPLKLKYRGWNSSSNSADHNYNWHDAIHSDPGSPNPCGANSTVPCDDHNHGTHTMGTMVGADGTNEIGVAPGAKWIGCRNMDEGVGTLTTYVECFQWFLAPTDLNGANANTAMAPHVINNSWSCPTSEGCNSGNFSTMETAVNNLLAAGVVVVVSAGNSGSSCSTVNAPPAIFAGSLSVGATNSSNGIGGFSSRGPVTVDGSNRMKPDVGAPGVGVRSVIIGGSYATWNGTSMAGPHVAGTVALIISANPSLAGQVTQIRSIIETTAGGQTTTDGCGNDTNTSSPNNTFGHGIADALAAVNSAMALLPVELIGFTGALTDQGVRLDWETALPGSLNHFEIEHSAVGQAWEAIGKMPFLPDAPRYAFLDDEPQIGQNYYRLKMVDLDGSFEYSKVVTVQLAGQGDLSVFPNPIHGELSLLADWEPGERTVLIFDAAGKLVKQVEDVANAGQDMLTIDVGNLLPGVYFVKILAGNGQRFLLQDKFVKM